MTLVEVFADITCPFRHVGQRQVVRELDSSTDIVVRAWPLEWVNGAPLDAVAVQVKIDALRSQLDLDDYAEGRRRGVTGSPDFWMGGEEFFCPSLDLDHDAVGDLRASFDTNGLARFISRVREFEASRGDQQ